MVLLIDDNVLLDVLQVRKPHQDSRVKALTPEEYFSGVFSVEG